MYRIKADIRSYLWQDCPFLTFICPGFEQVAQTKITGILTLYTWTLPCKWWCPFVLVLKKQHVSNGCNMYLLRALSWQVADQLFAILGLVSTYVVFAFCRPPPKMNRNEQTKKSNSTPTRVKSYSCRVSTIPTAVKLIWCIHSSTLDFDRNSQSLLSRQAKEMSS